MDKRTIGVCIVTYNEEKYIAQAIESVLEQECTAEVMVYVGNDASTDNTGIICREYAQRFSKQVVLIDNPRNFGLVGNTKVVLERIQTDGCDYIAMLDGDDYWCDKYKLQKQLDYLESHEDFGFVHTNQKLLFTDGTLKVEARGGVREGDVFEWAGKRETAIANCTAFFRTSLLAYCNMQDFLDYQFKSMDYAMYIIFMRYTKFHFMEDFTAVWRRGHVSVSGGGNIEKQIAYLENGIQQWKYLGYLFPDKWPYTEENGNVFRKRSILKLAYKYGNYEIAHGVAHVSFPPTSFLEKVQRLCASNKLLFSVLYNIHYKKKQKYR